MEHPKIEILEKKILDLEQMFQNPISDNGDNSNCTELNNEKKSQEMVASPVGLCNTYSTDWYSKMKPITNNNRGQMEKNWHFGHKNNHSEKSANQNIGSDKWASEKEKFLDGTTSKYGNADNTSRKDNQIVGTVRVKESFIELPRIGRISKSFHGKSPSKDSYLDIETAPRRASDNMVNLTSSFFNSKPSNNIDSQVEKTNPVRPKFCTQKSQPCPISSKEEFRKSSLSEPQNLKGARFTTTVVDENLFLESLKSSGIPKSRLHNE